MENEVAVRANTSDLIVEVNVALDDPTPLDMTAISAVPSSSAATPLADDSSNSNDVPIPIFSSSQYRISIQRRVYYHRRAIPKYHRSQSVFQPARSSPSRRDQTDLISTIHVFSFQSDYGNLSASLRSNSRSFLTGTRIYGCIDTVHNTGLCVWMGLQCMMNDCWLITMASSRNSSNFYVSIGLLGGILSLFLCVCVCVTVNASSAVDWSLLRCLGEDNRMEWEPTSVARRHSWCCSSDSGGKRYVTQSTQTRELQLSKP